MKTLNVMLSNLGGRVVPIGYEGENLYTRIRINCIEVFSEYPDATVSMVVSPPVGEMYPAVVEKSGVMVIWDITDSVLSSNGSGECQLTFTEGDVVRKSVVFGISINRSLVASGEAPEPVQEWIDRAEQTAQEIAENAAMLAKQDIVESYGEIAPAIIETASGAIASFSDGADGMLVKTLNVDIDPVQDLHGYDSPWPAGGGVNQWDEDWENGYYNRSTGAKDGNSNTTYFRSKNYIPCAPNTSYYFKAPSVHASNDTYFAVLFYDTDKSYISAINSGVGNTARTTPQNAMFMTFYIEVGTSDAIYQNDIAINYPSSVTTYSPYENVCPISGWDSANVSRTGKNLLDITDVEFEGWYNADGIKELSNSYNCYLVSVKPETTYTISGNFAGIITYWDSGLNFISGTNQGSGASKTFTTPANCAYIRRSILKTNIDGTQQLELGSSASTYEAYHGSTAEYEFPQEAGTVYGGSLTIHQDGSGELVVDRAKVTKAASAFLAHSTIAGRFYVDVGTSNQFLSTEKNLSNVAKSVTTSAPSAGQFYLQSGYRLQLQTNYASKAEFEAAMGSTDFEFCGKLATPVTYQLTNQQVIALLKGSNNIWADTGDVEVEYPADTKLYIDGKIAEIQALILENISNS